MMKVTAFDFGQADSFLVRGGKKDSPANVLIDCGSKKYIGTGLFEKLRMKNVKELDLLIITHIHQDHVGYLSELARSIKIKRAVFPYSQRSERLWKMTEDEETRSQLRLLYEAENILSCSKTEMLFTDSLPDFFPIYLSGLKLSLIYPSKTCNLSFLTKLKDRGKGESREDENILRLINGDSSVWHIEDEEGRRALFCGDCFEENFADRYFEFCRKNNSDEKINFLKLSHHGRNDKGHVYFSSEFVKRLRPDKILITNTEENFRKSASSYEKFLKESILIKAGEKVSEVEIA